MQPALNPAGGTATRIATRLPEPLRKRLTVIAAARGVPVSQVVRSALESYFERCGEMLAAEIAAELSGAGPPGKDG